MSSYMIRNIQQPQSPVSHLRFTDPKLSASNQNAPPFGMTMNYDGGAATSQPPWNSDLSREYHFGASSTPYTYSKPEFASTSALTYNTDRDESPTRFKSRDPIVNIFMGLADVSTKMLITHPCTVLRRQCQVHQFARSLHLTPLTFAPVICNVIADQGILTMWKGAIACGVLWAVSAASEILIADIFALPRTIVPHGSSEKFWRHVVLKAGTFFAVTPFFVSSFIETVRSERGLERDDIRVMDVITNAMNRLRFDLFGPRDNSKRFTLIHLSVPTVFYCTTHYLFTNTAYDLIYRMANRYVNRKPSNERTPSHQYLPDMFATMTSQVVADLVCYPFETILHRLYIQGTRTLIDNLDNGMSTIAITDKYTGFFDCTRSVINREGFWALYSGVGALAIQYMLHFSFLRLLRWLFDYVSQALDTSSISRTANLTEPSFGVGTSDAATTTIPSSFNYTQSPKHQQSQQSPSSAFRPSLGVSSAHSPKPSPYPTFGQTAASAFGRSSPPLIGSPASASALADYPLAPLLLSSDYSATIDDSLPNVKPR